LQSWTGTHVAYWISKAKNRQSEYVIFIDFHCNNDCTNAPQCYVIRMLPVLLRDIWRRYQYWTIV